MLNEEDNPALPCDSSVFVWVWPLFKSLKLNSEDSPILAQTQTMTSSSRLWITLRRRRPSTGWPDLAEARGHPYWTGRGHDLTPSLPSHRGRGLASRQVSRGLGQGRTTSTWSHPRRRTPARTSGERTSSWSSLWRVWRSSSKPQRPGKNYYRYKLWLNQ